MPYNNQRKIIIDEPRIQLHELTKRGMFAASSQLSFCGFKLYLYLLTKSDNEFIYYSPKEFSDLMGISNGSARKAPQDLVNHGYMRKVNEDVMTFCAKGYK